MSDTQPLLIEIGCEELPPKALDELAGALAQNVGEEFAAVNFPIGAIEVFCSPRRLALRIADVASTAPKTKTSVKAVPVKIGWDAHGQPTAVLQKKAASLGVAAEAFKPENDTPGAMLVAAADIGGGTLSALLPTLIDKALKRLPIPKPMRWGDHDFAFVRPVHWLVVLHGGDVIDVTVFGIKSGRESRGHRFHSPHSFEIDHATSYEALLREHFVLVDPFARRDSVASVLKHAASRLELNVKPDAELIAEISNLVEWPVSITCQFERDFLNVPHEALIQTMEKNQKFVPLFDDDGRLTEHFVGVANIESHDPDEIRKGYERVIRPRFADAKFFYDEDRKTPLADNLDALKSVTYQQQLGSVWDKSMRVAELARVIANRLGVDAARATRAAALSKCDLLSRMVGEFPELQGVMGRYYATANGEPDDVAAALDEFYRPRFAGDAIAQGEVARVLAVAERLDTLAGIFAVGMKPSGNKDPFALRRAALGLGRTLIEAKLDLDLGAALREAVELLPSIAPKAKKDGAPEKSAADIKQALTQELLDFVFERLRGYYADKNVSSDQFDAVRAVNPETLPDFDARLRAVVDFATLPEAAALAAANKRIGNILRQAGDSAGAKVDPALLDDGAERTLYEHVEKSRETVIPLLQEQNYVEALRTLAALRAPVDTFFDGVMVMADDLAKRRNRIALLNGLRHMFLQVADISVLQA